MRSGYSRLLGRLMFVVWVTTNLSQRMAELLVQLYAPVTFILSQHVRFQRQVLNRFYSRLPATICDTTT